VISWDGVWRVEAHEHSGDGAFTTARAADNHGAGSSVDSQSYVRECLGIGTAGVSEGEVVEHDRKWICESFGTGCLVGRLLGEIGKMEHLRCCYSGGVDLRYHCYHHHTVGDAKEE